MEISLTETMFESLMICKEDLATQSLSINIFSFALVIAVIALYICFMLYLFKYDKQDKFMKEHNLVEKFKKWKEKK